MIFSAFRQNFVKDAPESLMREDVATKSPRSEGCKVRPGAIASVGEMAIPTGVTSAGSSKSQAAAEERKPGPGERASGKKAPDPECGMDQEQDVAVREPTTRRCYH